MISRLHPFIYRASFLIFFIVPDHIELKAQDKMLNTPSSGRFVILGAKTSFPISWSNEPAGSQGEPWYSSAYNDAAWKAGNLDERNTVPPKMSKLWRVMVRVDSAPSLESKMVLKLIGDDDLTVYFDGYLVGSYGSVKKGGGYAGAVEVDVTGRLSLGNHVIGIRLDNGPGDSRMKMELTDVSDGSPEQLRDTFWKIISGSDEEAKRKLVMDIRQVAKANPKDQNLQVKAIYSYVYAPSDLRDTITAEAELNAFKNSGGYLSVGDEVKILKEIGKQEIVLPRLRKEAAASHNNPMINIDLGDILTNLGDLSGAAQAYSIAWEIALKNSRPFDELLKIAGNFTKIGRVDLALQSISVIKGIIESKPKTGQLGHLADLYQKIGDIKTADQLLAREKQLNLENSESLLNYRLMKRAFDTGDFENCITLSNYGLKEVIIRPSFREFYGVAKVRSLVALDQLVEANAACKEIVWETTATTSQSYLLRYLQIAKDLGSHAQVSASADQLAGHLHTAQKYSKYIKPSSEVIVEVAEAYHFLGKKTLAQQYAQWALDTTLDAPLPLNQWYRGRAAGVAGNKTLCTLALTKAHSLAPWHYRIAKDQKELPSKIP